jgi:NAD(P) transhydrogenase subunit alpha
VRVGIPAESRPAERRVACVPETVRALVGAGLDVVVQAGAGVAAHAVDAAYRAEGAQVVADDPVGDVEVVLSVQPLEIARARKLRAGDVTISFLPPSNKLELVRVLAERGVTAFSLDLLPRVTRAQGADALSSQALVAGYRAVLVAAERLPRFLPMFTTAAGTVPPAKVLVLGAGVAGLQAIATARRLGAVVTATDVRPATKEQVESLGAKFLAVEDEEFKNAQTAGGYAKEMSKEYQAKQAALTAEHIKKQDIIITTALIPGRPAPRLVTSDMVKSMKPGSVLIDLAIERGGNVEGAKANEVVDADGVKIVGYTNVAGRVAQSASSLYARNLFNFIETMVDKTTKALDVKWDDELVKATALTKDGAVIHPNFQPKA